MSVISSPPTTRYSSADLQTRIARLYDHLYANAQVRTPNGISVEVGKILHTGMFVEEAQGRAPAFEFGRSELKDVLDSSSELVRQLAGSVRKRFREMNAAWRLYDEDASIELGDPDIAFACAQFDGLLLGDRSRDVFGDALEIFRSTWAKRAGGQFFTDQRVTHLAMALLEFDPRAGDDLVDPAAGTGGFLLAALNRIRALLDRDGDQGSREELLATLARQSLKGVEVDPDVCAAANATLAARIGPLNPPIVTQADTLKALTGNGGQVTRLCLDSHRCVATNPPFGTKITIKDPQVLRSFHLARVQSSPRELTLGVERVSARAPDILFLELGVRLLAPGRGRLAIVVPYQILSGPQTLFIRQWLLRHAEVLAVVDLPLETFQPHTGTKACLLVVRRRPAPLESLSDAHDTQVFMSTPKWIGHDRRGNPVLRKDEAGRGTGEVLTDFAEVEAALAAFRRGEAPGKYHEGSFVVEAFNIARDPLCRLNALYYRPSGVRLAAATLARSEHDWRRVRLGDVVQRVFFPTRFKRDYVRASPGAVPFLGGANISEWIHTSTKWLRGDDPRRDELVVREGWILITRSGTTGIVSSVPKAWDGVAMSEHVIRVVPDPAKLSARYLEVFLRSTLGQDVLARGVFGSVIDEITPEYVCDIEVLVPKSTAEYSLIVKMLEDAQEARQTSIELMTETVRIMNKALLGERRLASEVD